MKPRSTPERRSTVDPWRTMRTWPLVGYLAGVGAVAGFAAWALMWVLDLLFGIGRPSLMSLVLAVLRGAVFGVVLALILRAYWNRSKGMQDSARGR